MHIIIGKFNFKIKIKDLSKFSYEFYLWFELNLGGHGDNLDDYAKQVVIFPFDPNCPGCIPWHVLCT